MQTIVSASKSSYLIVDYFVCIHDQSIHANYIMGKVSSPSCLCLLLQCFMLLLGFFCHTFRLLTLFLPNLISSTYFWLVWVQRSKSTFSQIRNTKFKNEKAMLSSFTGQCSYCYPGSSLLGGMALYSGKEWQSLNKPQHVLYFAINWQPGSIGERGGGIKIWTLCYNYCTLLSDVELEQ